MHRFIAGIAIAFALASAVFAQIDNGVQINTDAGGSNIVGDAANEPSFAVSPVDPDVMVVGWRQFPTISSDARYAGFARTNDGGATWFNGGTLLPPPGAPDAQQSDPVVAVDEFGSFFYNSLIFRSSRDGLTVYRSDDGGRMWNDAVYMIEGFRDKNWYTTDRTDGVGTSNHYCCWSGGLVRSTDDAMTWSIVDGISPGFMSAVHVGPAGELFVGWREWTDIYLRRSDNAQDPAQQPTFTNSTRLPFGNPPRSLPINPGGEAGQVHIQSMQRANRLIVFVLASSVPPIGGDVCDVLFARSVDGGLSFSDPIRVNDDSSPDDYQWMAAMSLAPGGRIDAVWFDTRDDPDHFLSRLYYASSYDLGDTWTANRPLSDQFDSTVGWPHQSKIGDYFQCHSDNAGVNVVYPATFNGEQDIYFRRANPALLESTDFIGGEEAVVTLSSAWPGREAWVLYSTDGYGKTEIPSLGIRIDLARPRLAFGPRRADQAGNAEWRFVVPDRASGVEVLLQAVQRHNASKVIKRTVQ